MKTAYLAVAAACLILLSSPAQACMSHLGAFIHDALPVPLPASTIIAEVDLGVWQEEHGDPLVQDLRADIRRVVQGDYEGQHLILRTSLTSCDNPFGNGRSGLIVALPQGVEDGILVADPIRALSPDHRLPDGYQVAPQAARAAQAVLDRMHAPSSLFARVALPALLLALVGAAIGRAATSRRSQAGGAAD